MFFIVVRPSTVMNGSGMRIRAPSTCIVYSLLIIGTMGEADWMRVVTIGWGVIVHSERRGKMGSFDEDY